MTQVPPTVRTPTREELREKAAKQFIHLTEDELDDFEELAPGFLTSMERLDEMVEPRPSVEYTDRGPVYRPGPEEDPLNAFVTKCLVEGADDGPLAGYDVGVKDNISVAGVELTNGSKVLEGFVPTADATVVTRILDAGGTIVGKLNMEDMAFSGGGDLSAFGPVFHPRDPDYLAGGSSSGSAAAVVSGDVDVSLGTDQAGSVRAPASWCGCVGLKPTHGLVPYTGGLSNGSYSIDHIGPLARSVEDVAVLLDAIAGADPLDPRQGEVPVQDYAGALEADLGSLSVGVVEEGFGIDTPLETSDPGVDATVRGALEAFEDGADGVDVRETSIPLQRAGFDLWASIATEAAAAIADSEGVGHFVEGFYDTQFMEHFAKSRRTRANDYPPLFKLVVTLGQYLRDEYHGHYHAKAQNCRRTLRAAFDEALAEFDVLALPATVTTAIEYREDVSRLEIIDRTFNITNTTPQNVTGHPAISIPCGTAGGLPVGLMLVGERFDDAGLLQAANAFEETVEVDLE